MRIGNKGGRGKRRKRWSRVRRQLNRLGSDKAALRGWAKQQATAIHGRRIKHISRVGPQKSRG